MKRTLQRILWFSIVWTEIKVDDDLMKSDAQWPRKTKTNKTQGLVHAQAAVLAAAFLNSGGYSQRNKSDIHACITRNTKIIQYRIEQSLRFESFVSRSEHSPTRFRMQAPAAGQAAFAKKEKKKGERKRGLESNKPHRPCRGTISKQNSTTLDGKSNADQCSCDWGKFGKVKRK